MSGGDHLIIPTGDGMQESSEAEMFLLSENPTLTPFTREVVVVNAKGISQTLFEIVGPTQKNEHLTVNIK